MTIYANIHPNLSAWATGTVYAVGNRVSSGGNAYQATSAGTSGATAPTGTTTANDGGVTWRWLSAINYTTIQAWADALPNPLTQAVVGQLWNNGAITFPSGQSVLFLAANSGASSSNTITLTCAPGESFRDKAGGAPLFPNQANGVLIQNTNANTFTNFIEINPPYFILDGIQFVDTNSGSVGTVVNFESTATNGAIRNSLISGYGQSGGAAIIGYTGSPLAITNSVIIDGQAAPGQGNAIDCFGSAASIIFENSIIYNANGITSVDGISGPGTIRNSLIFGYSAPANWGSNSINVDHSAFTAASATAGIINGAGVTYSANPTSYFVSPGTNFLPLRTSPSVDAGAADTTNLPTADDIFRRVRALGSAWDQGPVEYLPISSASAIIFRGSGVAGQSDIATGSSQPIRFAATGAALQTYAAAGSARWLQTSATGGISQAGGAFGNAAALLFTASGTVSQFAPAAGFTNFLNYSVVGSGINPNGIAGNATWLQFRASGILTTSTARGAATWLSISATGRVVSGIQAAGSGRWLTLSAIGIGAQTASSVTTYYLQFGLSAWQPNQLYTLGARVSNGGNAYIVTSPGRSQNFAGAGPSGTGSVITDGTVTWAWISRIDFSDLATFAAALPATLTTAVIAYCAGALTLTSPFTLSGHATTAANTITFKALPGYGFRDAGGGPLALNPNACLINTPPTGSYSWNWIDVADANVIFDGMQLRQSSGSDNCTLLQVEATGSVTLLGCIVDGYPQANGAFMLAALGPLNIENSLVVDREPAGGPLTYVIDIFSNSLILNSTIVAINSVNGSGYVARTGVPVNGAIVRNSIFANYSSALYAEAANILTVDHSAFTAASYGGNVNPGAGNLLGATIGFQAAGTDFRIGSTSPCIDAGIADPVDLPGQNDIFYRKRPLGSGWDIGAAEKVPNSQTAAITFTATGRADVGYVARGTATPFVFSARGGATTDNPASCVIYYPWVLASGRAIQEALASGNAQAITFTASGSAATPNAASCTIYYPWVTASGLAVLDVRGSGGGNFLGITAAGRGTNPLAARGTGTWLSIAAAGVAIVGTQAIGNATALQWTAQGNSMPSYVAAGGATPLRLSASGQAVFPNGLYGSASPIGWQMSASMVQESKVSATVPWLGIYATGNAAMSVAAGGTGQALAFTAAGSGINPKPWVGNTSWLAFTASGAVSEFTTAVGAAQGIQFTSSGAARLEQGAGGSGSFLTISAAGTLAPTVFAAGLANAIQFTSVAAAGMEAKAYGVARPLVIAASGLASKELIAQGSGSFSLSLTGLARQEMTASGATQWFTPSASGGMTVYAATGSARVLQWSAQGSALQGIAAAGDLIWLDLAASGSIHQAAPAAGQAAWFNLAASGTAFQLPLFPTYVETLAFPADDRMISL